ncbi:MAG: glycosyltransferase family 39 protein [Anaerolineales bacterium]|jgi:hypothetical protein|nr:glycosyltransferase family 39 protein [Anaerolineales bacterium]
MSLVAYFRNKISAAPGGWKFLWSADFLAFLGVLIYLLQAIAYAHTTISDLDEGGYLLKGWLFALGKYRPFDPGISTNKGPLAFLIPGYAQLLFGAGLRTGRYLAVVLGALAIVGVWLTSKRLGNQWLAAGAVWVFALNLPVIKVYSVAVTQSTIAFMLAWTLVLLLDEKRPPWQLFISGILAGAMMMVRQNMMPVLPLLCIYALVQYRWRGLWFVLPGLAVTGWFFYIYWPDILQLWTWIPFVTISSEVIYQGGGMPAWQPVITTATRMLSVFQSIRLHFVTLVGSLMVVFLWQRRSKWESDAKLLAAITLFALFWGLVFMHAMAAIGLDYCVFCLKNYIAFFNIAGILLIVVSAGSWNWHIPRFAQISVVILGLAAFAVVGFSAFEDIGNFALTLPALRIRDQQILPSLITWRDVLVYGFDLNLNSAKKAASLLLGTAMGMIITGAAYSVWRWAWRSPYKSSFGSFFVSVILIVGGVAAPVLGGSYGNRDCNLDVLASSELIGEHLQGIIPAGSSVYWDGGLSATPLLYLSGVTIYPAQINSAYSFKSGGDTQEARRFGLWNEELRAEWKATADFIIVEEARYQNWQQYLSPAEFDEYLSTPVGTSCVEETRLRIFKRKQ